MCTTDANDYVVSKDDLASAGIRISKDGDLLLPLRIESVVAVRRMSDAYRKVARHQAEKHELFKVALDELQRQEDEEAEWRSLAAKIGGMTVEEVKAMYRKSSEDDLEAALANRAPDSGVSARKHD